MEVKYGYVPDVDLGNSLEDIPQEIISPLFKWMKDDPRRQGIRIEVKSPYDPASPIAGWKHRSIEGEILVQYGVYSVEGRLVWDSGASDFALVPVHYEVYP